MMISFHNIKYSIRSLLKNKAVTTLNLIGLTVGITVSIFIFLFGQKERNTDKSISGVQNIYVLTNNNGKIYFSQKMVNHIKKEIPEIDYITYCCPDWSPQVFLSKNQENYKVNKMITADSCFFRVFSFKTVWGNPQKAFNSANKIVLTRSLSEKIFGKENPVGKPVIYNATYLQGEELEVVAVIDDFPQTVSWDFDAVLSLQTNFKINWYVDVMKNWGSRNYQAFAKANEHAPEQVIRSKLANINLDEVPEDSKSDIHYGTFPFIKAYFDLPQLEITRHGNKFVVSIIEIVGLLILLLACVNYINMVTAQREKRYKNIGVFKTMGSTSRKILGMATTESIVLIFTAISCSIVITILLVPWFNLLTGSKFSINGLFSEGYFLLLTIVTGIMVLLTGIVPGFIFSKESAILLIRKNLSTNGNNWVRNSLLVFQFSVSIALIASVLLIYKQNNYLQHQGTGFNKENIVYANTNKEISNHINAFKNELKKISGVTDFTFSESLLIANDQNWGMGFINKGEKYNVDFSKMSVAPNFFQFFGVKLTEGETFNDESKANGDFIFNKKAKSDFKIEKMEEARVEYSTPKKGHIIGIADNYNFESLHVPIKAAGFMCSGDCDDVIYLKINTSNLIAFNTTIDEIEQLWKRVSPNFPMEYKFLDQTYTNLYAREAQFQRFLLYTTFISLILSCLGLIGLTFFVMEQRTKEIGVRKVNGAKISEIIAMLNSNFVKWVAIAFVIATPIAYYTMNKWLENFAYKTELSWWIFALAGLLALGIALLTVSWQSWKAATKNPVEALRYE